MADLKLFALDEQDLAVISAHVQDAIIRFGDIAFLPRQRCFAAIINRFDWAASIGTGGPGSTLVRRRAALRFERVLSARFQGIDPKAPGQLLSLLMVHFSPGVAPGGTATLIFAGGGAIQLELECIEVELKDLGAAWRTSRQPRHASEVKADDDSSTGERAS